MSDLIADDGPTPNAPEFTVSEISGAVKRTVEGAFSHVRVRGEVGRVSRPRSGHVYLDLKDERNVLAAIIWKGVASRLATQPEEGMEVIATGRLTTYGGQSRYQMVIEDIAPAGVGALMAMLEKRKAQLAAEGLFAPERKQTLPYLPQVIGVVTSPSGAVIRDILHRLRDRFPRKVLIWPVAVQGANCAPEVARAIRGFNALTPGGALPRPDLLIVARGGGSLEDLWGFNEEIVVRAAAESAIPLISAVGHETDTTLIDFAADRRAPTPTAAAEMAVPVRMELLATLDALEARRSGALSRLLQHRRQRLADLSRALSRPETLVESAAQRLDRAADRLPAALRARIAQEKLRLSEASAALRPATLRRRIAEEQRRLDDRAGRIAPALNRLLRQRRADLDTRTARLRPEVIARRIEEQRTRLAELDRRAQTALAAGMDRRRTRLDALERMRAGLSYEETLRRGFAVVWSGDKVMTTRTAAETATGLEIQFQDGRLALGGQRTKAGRKTDEPPEQGSLF
ncbi:exodeoxyribonuclease VII large subunit [Rhodovulum adriaticum]|uniref:Exodeoxyribonuclease 7 large subunit n=1 Tax=Rhodovulum adriaticum TaxID=35804 RepID=A0A4R2NJC8_RHOAD|nr:exodeoxyribonuclease VII large subunit [Rhodovulum adriaticum]MBK1634724.1 exodeoxyribonuclease VII large subunit [Rhodovulum adriaticum]TCP21567.1 exodeoxyribonuclease VII large subunit [Rhodovulum adriaticum]